MQLPLQITFRNLDHSDAIEADIREKAAKLDRFHDQIMSCRVIVEGAHKHHHKGNLYQVRIDLTVPGRELVVTRAPDQHRASEDVYVAIRDAFDALRRQLQDHARQQRGEVKAHEAPAHGRVSALVPAENFGKIETPDGREVYFHRNSVLDDAFDRLVVGCEVRFTEEAGEQGPQASSVQLIGKHHIVA